MGETISDDDVREKSVGTMISYGFGKFAGEFFTLAFTTYCFFFYETELFLNKWLVAAGLIIYSLWNAINDPLVGYLTRKPLKKLEKYGKRFPWIVIGAIPYVFTYILIFVPPNVDPETQGWILFIWLTIFSCLFDTFYSLWDVHFQSMFPDKFRGTKERIKAAGVASMVGVFGIALGGLIPPMLIEEGNLSSYITQGVVVTLVGFIAVMAMLPGVREDKEMKERYEKHRADELKNGSESFMKILKFALKQRNLMAFLIMYMLYQSLTQIMTGSMPYYVQFVLGMEQGVVTYILAAFLVGALISIPFWMKLAHKVNDHAKMYRLGCILLGVISLPFLFLKSLIIIIIVMFLWGIALGLSWAMISPVMADAIDEIVVKTHKRDDGVYFGIRALFGRLAYVVMSITFATVHALTGFIEDASVQTDAAVFGIHLHTSLIPSILIFIGVIIFWKLNDLTPEKTKKIRDKLKELNL